MSTGPNEFGAFRSHESVENSPQKPSWPTSGGEQDDRASTDDEQNGNKEDGKNQLVIYDPSVNGAAEIALIPDSSQSPQLPGASKVYRSVGAFAVQCANCFKWRLIPKKEKYEEIREHILEVPFLCEMAREWKPEISCDDPPDITQDGSSLWAIDKPNIAVPPRGWQRLLRIRGDGGTRFADVYYVSPSGKRFRSMVEIERYLEEHPECVHDGVSLSRFSFQTPKPLQKNTALKKRPPATSTPSHDGFAPLLPAYRDLSEANPVAWNFPNKGSEVKLCEPGVSLNPNACDIESCGESTIKRQKQSTDPSIADI